jgi:23S rRNA (guanosine2251-2'-O)-methyltransferase
MDLMELAGIGAEVEGIHAVTAAVAAGRVTRLWVERSRQDSMSDLMEAARSRGAAVAVVEHLRDAMTSAPQGVRAVCHPISPVPLDVAVRRSAPAALVVLDHLEDPRNVGAVARSAVAAGFTGLIMSGNRAAPLGAAAFKAGAGSFEHLDIVVVGSIASAVDDLKRLNVWTVGLDGDGDQSLFGMGLFTEPVAVVLGAEGAGLSRLVRERVDVVASIPIDPRVESLNASVAAALALFEVARVRSSE